MELVTSNQGAAENGLSAVRSSVAGIRERTVRSTVAPEGVAELGRYPAGEALPQTMKYLRTNDTSPLSTLKTVASSLDTCWWYIGGNGFSLTESTVFQKT
jgi:hypothetical protein